MALHRVTILTKPDCPACDAVVDTVYKVVSQHADVLVQEVDILQNPDLHAEYNEAVPVVLVDAVEKFRGTMDAQALARLFYDEFGMKIVGLS